MATEYISELGDKLSKNSTAESLPKHIKVISAPNYISYRGSFWAEVKPNDATSAEFFNLFNDEVISPIPDTVPVIDCLYTLKPNFTSKELAIA